MIQVETLGQLENRWFNDEAYRKKLIDILGDPTMQLALRIIELRIRPAMGIPPSAGFDLTQWNALQHARHEGAQGTLTLLEQLCRPRTARQEDPTKPWAYDDEPQQ